MGFLLLIVALTTTFGTAVPVGYTIGVVNAPAEVSIALPLGPFSPKY